jgi:hypothetical protein
MKKNREWFTIILAMWIVLVISLTAYNILWYIIPFSKEIKWVENSSKAYYLWNSWIEEWLYDIYTRLSTEEKKEFSKNYNWNITYKYNTFSSWSILPPLWEWNSDYNKDFNTIAQWNPLQLSIWNWYLDINKEFNVIFKVPDIKWNWSFTLNWGTLAIVNWQLSWINNTLNASWGIIMSNYINSNNINSSNNNNMFDDSVTWFDLNWDSNIKFSTFYNANCWTNSWCTLKMSVVNNLETTSWISIPYLEWEMNSSIWGKILPLRYTKLDSFGKSMWYVKKLEIKVPRKTVNQAFDFTVFQ